MAIILKALLMPDRRPMYWGSGGLILNRTDALQFETPVEANAVKHTHNFLNAMRIAHVAKVLEEESS